MLIIVTQLVIRIGLQMNLGTGYIGLVKIFWKEKQEVTLRILLLLPETRFLA